MKKTFIKISKIKHFGIGTFSIPLLIFAIIFPLQIFNEPRKVYDDENITILIEYNIELSLGEKILDFFDIPAWSKENSQGKNYTFIYAYFLFYSSLFIGNYFPNHFLALSVNKKILFIIFSITTILLILFYTVNSPIVQEPTISEHGI